MKVIPISENANTVLNRELEEKLAATGKPSIKLTEGGHSRAVKEIEATLIKTKAPVLVRGGKLVTPDTAERPASKDRRTQVTRFRTLNAAALAFIVGDVMSFTKKDGRTSTDKPINLPKEVAEMLLDKGNWKLPEVTGIITTPTLRPNGTLLNQPGYDPKTQLWYAPADALELPPIEANRAAAETALSLLKQLLRECAFGSDLDQSVALAALMTPVLRAAFTVAPLILFLSHSPGAGKSYIADMANTIARAQICPVISSGPDIPEMEKRLSAVILEGVPIISIDNCSHDLGGDLLCQMVERQLIMLRILGKSKIPECEWPGTVFATGNNINLIGDMTRRGLLCNLDPKEEQPELREFKYDPLDMIMRDRGAYVAAILTIALEYIQSGDRVDCSPIASYGGWSRFVREPLIRLGEADVVKSMEQARESDPIRNAAQELVTLWKEVFGCGHSYPVSFVIERANRLLPGGAYEHPELRSLLLSRCHGREGIDGIKLGMWLKRIARQVHAGHRFIIDPNIATGHQHHWQLIDTNQPEPSEAERLAAEQIARDLYGAKD
jgi:putative DNA primase/helicase